MLAHKCDVCKQVKEGTTFNITVSIYGEERWFQAGPHCKPFKYLTRDVCFSCMKELNELLFLPPVYDLNEKRVNE